MTNEIILEEKYGCLGVKNVYVKPSGQNAIVGINSSQLSPNPPRSSILFPIKRFFTEVFLPQGYPSSVSDDYWSYQTWDTVQAFCSSICGTLTTHAIMKGVGVGDTSATPLAAAITWILKDGTGMLGRIVFAWWKGSRLDSECKVWRLVADVLNDMAMFVEMIIPWLSSYSSVILCISYSAKAIVGVAGGATRAAITQHQAIRGNTGDVSAKDGSQETCVNLVASFVGIFILTAVSNSIYLWSLFLVSMCLHILANYKAVRSLKLLTLSEGRFNLVLQSYFSSRIVPSPSVINERESVFAGFGFTTQQLCGFNIVLGCSFQKFLKKGKRKADDITSIIDAFKNSEYMLIVDSSCKTIFVFFSENESAQSVFEAYFHAVLLALSVLIFDGHALPSGLTLDSETSQNDFISSLREHIKKLKAKSTSVEALTKSKAFFSAEFNVFYSCLVKSGWAIDRHHLIIDEWRASWAGING